MYCPRCGQEQISHETRFCSRCGFLMNGLAEIVVNGGVIMPNESKPPSPRRKGLKQGGAWFLLGVFIVSLLGALNSFLNFPDVFVAIAAIVFFLGGFLRMIYAVLLESGNPNDKTLEQNVMQTAQKLMNKKPQTNLLPSEQSIPVNNYAPPPQNSWRDTNDLTPPSVTDNTTKLLSKDDER